MGTSRSKLILMVGVLGISASAILVRFSRAPSGVLAVYRLGWTVLLLLPVVLLRYRAELKRVTGRDVLLCAASGICLAIHFLAWFESLRLTSVSVSTVLVSTEVIFTAIGFALFLKGKIPRLGVAAILVPSPYVAHNHQFYNASVLVEADAAVMIEEANLNAQTLHEAIASILCDPISMEHMRVCAENWASRTPAGISWTGVSN